MNVIDKFLKQYSYKFDKGYPDIGNPKDKEMLFEFAYKLTEKKTILKEGSEVYDKTILRALGTDSIPQSKNKYQWNGQGGSTFDIQVKQDDMDTWKKLFGVAPPKKGEEEGQTKGVGNGEVALYWLYNFSNSGVDVDEGRAGDDPDLFFNGVGVEVKAYSSHKGKIGLGRFGADKENLQLLGIIFGINALVKALGEGEALKTINPTNFKGSDLIPAMEQVLKMSNIDLEQLASIYPLFKTIKSNVYLVFNTLDDFNSPEEGARFMAHKMVSSKLGRKPGPGGYLANVLSNGDCKFYSIDLEKVKTSDDFLKNFGVTQSSMGMNFFKIFG